MSLAKKIDIAMRYPQPPGLATELQVIDLKYEK
jgi:hypothetical protein